MLQGSESEQKRPEPGMGRMEGCTRELLFHGDTATVPKGASKQLEH